MSMVRSFRSLLLSAAIAIAVLGAASAPAWGQGFSVNITVDENGHGTLTNTNNFFANLASSTTLADPGPGSRSNVLSYNLLNPPGLVLGDLIIAEAGDFNSDVVRFDPTTGGGTMFFYSDTDGGVDAIADIGLPTAFNTNTLRVAEVNFPGGGNGLIYTPIAGQPGFVAGSAGPVTYTIISDAAVPEPSTLLLFFPAAALVMLYRRRTHNTRRA